MTNSLLCFNHGFEGHHSTVARPTLPLHTDMMSIIGEENNTNWARVLSEVSIPKRDESAHDSLVSRKHRTYRDVSRIDSAEGGKQRA
jgi:hypothetical protein